MSVKTGFQRIGLQDAGFTYNRNWELIADNALIEPSRNNNMHNGGLEKRGGTAVVVTPVVTSTGRGGFDFRQSSGTQYMIYAKANGTVYYNDDSNTVVTGMSTSNYFHFSQYDDDLYICDGGNIPKYWSGSGAASNVTVATDWATYGYPFQIIQHSQGANRRNWAITKNGVYASKNNEGYNFSDAEVKYIPVYSRGGLVGGFEFNGELFVWSKTQVFRIDDTDVDSANWGYQEAIWEGGAAHWRLICKAANQVYVMTDDAQIYTISSVFSSSDYEISSLSRPAFVDRYLREKGVIGNIEQWHCTYDKRLRAIKWFVQVGGSSVNTALVYFIDLPPEKAWQVHDNSSYASGYRAACSFEYRSGTGTYKIRTVDQTGKVWQLEESARDDEDNPYEAKFKFRPWDFGNPIMWKRFHQIIVRARADSNVTFTVRVWIDGVRQNDETLAINGSGSTYDSATYDSSVYADDNVSFEPFKKKTFGYNMQLEFVNNTAGQDYFVSELVPCYKEVGIRFDD